MSEIISRDELKSLIDTDAVTVIDALPASYYDQQHLPGAMNLVEAEVDARAGQLLRDISAPIVTYCSNAACGNSQAVANRLARLGYSNIRKYAEGIQDWTEHGLPVESTVRGNAVSQPRG